jgi:uncharacterized membrane protein YcaP (DUF421 family)
MDALDPDVTFLSNGLVPVLRVLFITVAGYVTLLTLLRASGQRTLAQLTPFDLVITVTLGSAFGRVITARDVAVIEVLAAFGTLIALQVVVSNLWGRLGGRAHRLVALTPAVLYHDGEVVTRELRRHQLRVEDLHAAVRQEGMGSLDDARTILLEGNGSFAVLTAEQYGDGAAVEALVPGPGERG